MSATQCLKHDWLNNLPAKASKSKVRLKSQLLLQKYTAQRQWKVAAPSRVRPLPRPLKGWELSVHYTAILNRMFEGQENPPMSKPVSLSEKHATDPK